MKVGALSMVPLILLLKFLVRPSPGRLKRGPHTMSSFLLDRQLRFPYIQPNQKRVLIIRRTAGLVVLIPRGGEGKMQILNVPNWVSTAEGPRITTQFNDFLQRENIPCGDGARYWW